MKIDSSVFSPNFSSQEIKVEFLVIHYTACDLARTLQLFTDPHCGLTSHFVLDIDGCCYDLGKTLSGKVLKGAHAGKSQLQIDDRQWTAFNEFSIGIEIVNLNGNILNYTDAQYQSLKKLTQLLQDQHPALGRSERIVGHEHIAGFRGKCDPGLRFDWQRYLNDLGLRPLPLHSQFVCDTEDLSYLQDQVGDAQLKLPGDWSRISSQLEARIAARAPKV